MPAALFSTCPVELWKILALLALIFQKSSMKACLNLKEFLIMSDQSLEGKEK